MNIKKTGLLLAAFSMLFILALSAHAAEGGIVVVANKNVEAGSISKEQIKRIFLGQQTTWDNGKNITFVLLKKGDVENSFLEEYVGQTSSQFNRHWRTQVFTGKGKLPRGFNSDNELVNYVSGEDGAIGFVSAGTDTSSVKVLTIN